MNLPIDSRYDVVIAGARAAGASTALLMARHGLRVLVVDPVRRGSDTLSTHALMREGVLQLHRWGVLDSIRERGTPAVTTTTFHYGDESIRVPIKAKDGVDALYAPRRTVLDLALVEAAEAAGATFVHGVAVKELERDAGGRVCGVVVSGGDVAEHRVQAELVVGADGARSRVARLVEAPVERVMPHATASIYGHWSSLEQDGYHWFYHPGSSIGLIPTNDGESCVFASVLPRRFHEERHLGLDGMYRQVLEEIAPDIGAAIAEEARGARSGKLRAFAGAPGFLRRSVGPGWALVGDAGYFRDPITAHGISDALRDAELLADAAVQGGREALEGYQATRDELVTGLLEVTDEIAAFDWDLESVKELHLGLSREMNRGVELLRSLDAGAAVTGSLAGVG